MSTPPPKLSAAAHAAHQSCPPPGQPDYMDHLTRRRQIWPYGLYEPILPEGWLEWPRRADRAFTMQKITRALTRTEVAAPIMRYCDYIGHARAFGMRWLHVQLQSELPLLRLPRAMYAVPERSGDAGTGVCADVTAAARARVRCNDAAYLAMRLVSTSALLQRPGDLRRSAEFIIGRVCDGYCNRVQATAAEVMGIGIAQGSQGEPLRHYSAVSAFSMGVPGMSLWHPVNGWPRPLMPSPKLAAMDATLLPLPLPPRNPVAFSSSAMLATRHVPYPDPLVGRTSSHTPHQLQQPRKH